MVKMIREIISMPRADSGYPHYYTVNAWVFRMRSLNLMPKPRADPTADIERVCSWFEVRSWHGEYMH